MALTCNIDARGKAARLLFGIGATLVGLVMLFAWALPKGTSGAWFVTMSVIAAGMFAIFEARSGWCVVRAMGIRTPL